MNAGPSRTDLSGFRGFSLAAKPGTGAKGASGRPAGGLVAASSRPAPQGTKTHGQRGVAALFAESAKASPEAEASAAAPSWSKLSIEAVQAQRHAETLQADDPSVFQYDEVLDDIKSAQDVERPTQAVRANGLEQRKRVGLVIPQGGSGVVTGSRRQAKYIDKVLVATDRRRVEQQIVEDKLLRKDKEKFEGCETFVTGGFKDELARRKKFEDDLERQDFIDSVKAAEKQSDGKGFADMYRNLLNGGLATSRGGEKLKEQEPARVDAEAVKEEPEVDVEEERGSGRREASRSRDPRVKEEDDSDAGRRTKRPAPGEVVAGQAEGEAAADSRKRRKQAEAEQRQEKATSARDRYLARKQAGSNPPPSS